MSKALRDERKDAAISAATALTLAAAGRLEGEAALAVVAGDVSHDLLHTLNFLRCLIAEASEAATLSAEDLTTAQREADRLQRILSSLRRLYLAPPDCKPVPIGPLLREVKAELAPAFVAKSLSLAFSFDEDAELVADRRLLHLLLRAVLSELVGCAAERGRIELQLVLPIGGDCGALMLWATTATSVQRPESEDFALWTNGEDGAVNFAPSIADLATRALGWTLSTTRSMDRQEVRVTIPPAASPKDVGR